MNLLELIDKDLPPLKSSDTVEKALNWMHVFNVRHLPVLKDKTFVGVIEYEALKKILFTALPLSATDIRITRAHLYADQHFYNAFSFCANHKLEIVPVLGRNEEYIGVITVTGLLESFGRLRANVEGFSILVLSCPSRDYQLSKIVSIAESNGANIISIDVASQGEGGQVEITLRLENIDLSRIEAGFFRQGYIVTGVYRSSEPNSDMQDRYDSFMKYLDM